MTAVSSQSDISADGDATGEDARTGLALLTLLAEAADPHAQDWVNRRVEQLEFLDTRAVRWQVSVDFVVPENAPLIDVGGRKFRLVPLTSWEKSDLVAFNLRDEGGNTLWLPTSEFTTRVLAAALTFWASILLPPALGGSPGTGGLPGWLKDVLEAIVFSEPTGPQKDMNPFAAVDPGHGRDPAILALEQSTQFVSQLTELWRNFLIIVAVPDQPGTRRVLKLSFESRITFRRPRDWFRRLLQSLGWRSWRLDVFIGGRGGSHHLEIAAPAGVDIVQISAQPVDPDDTSHKITVQGGAPHVHIRVPARQRSRYRATIRVRVSRPGWLTSCWLAGLVIAGVLLIGRLKITALFSVPGGGAQAQADTAATLLLALLAVVATMLIGPGGHPLASRLLMVTRLLILADSAAVLVGVGDLLLHTSPHPPTALWTALAWVSAVIAFLLTLSRLLPKGPHRKEAQTQRGARQLSTRALTAAQRTRSLAMNATAWVRKTVARTPGSEADGGGVHIPAADGYHYGDDNPWGPEDLTALVTELKRVELALTGRATPDSSAEDSPSPSPASP
jgi:hypothetical protein